MERRPYASKSQKIFSAVYVTFYGFNSYIFRLIHKLQVEKKSKENAYSNVPTCKQFSLLFFLSEHH